MLLKNNSKIKFKKKVLNLFMRNGLKCISEKIFIKVLKNFQKNFQKNSKKIMKFSLISLSPLINFRKKIRKKKILFEIPFLLKPYERIFIVIKKMLKILKKSYIPFSTNFYKNLYINFYDLNNNYKSKEIFYKNFSEKKKFCHFRWWF